jgi:hypothetical protein
MKKDKILIEQLNNKNKILEPEKKINKKNRKYNSRKKRRKKKI